MQKPELLTVQQAATYLDIRPSTLQQWRNKNTGPDFVRIGRLIRYQRDALDRYLAVQSRAPARRDQATLAHRTILAGAAHV